jgi:type I restriction enzyme, R subunit
MPPLNREGLRDCQVEATNAVEASLARNHPRSLVQMATGAGKTFTAATLSYRLLAHAGFRRILFLADRANLVRQTRDEYLAYRPPGTGRSFAELYNVQKLGPAGLDASAQVVVATIQRVYATLTGAALSEDDEEVSSFERGAEGEKVVAYSPAFPIESFDLIVTDECHRSIYGTWRQVLDYFDAFILGLTATPSLHTMGYFNRNLVAQYPYERSVVDGVNVGFEVFRIRTEIGERGATVKAGYDLPVRDKRTRAERYETLTEDFSYAPSDLDKTVIAPNQIRTVIEAYRDSLFTELFPGRREVPKTLVFAKDDHHAEEIVGIVRDVFGKGNDFAKKITYRADGGDPDLLIRQFRNDFNPRIAVTVDMIATGTDVKPIEALIFLRDVKASQYFEQMKGRGARTIAPEKLREVTPDAEAKTRFVLMDAVGVTESLKSVSQPLDRDRKIGFEKLIEQIAAGRRDEDAFATLAARLAALDRRIGDRDRSRITTQAGLDLAGLAARLLDAVDPDTLALRVPRDAPEAVQTRERIAAMDEAARVFDDPALRRLLVEVKQAADIRIDSITTDAVVSSGWDAEKAGEEVERFKRFLDEKRNELVALQILYRLPHVQRRFTYQALDDLRDAMRSPPWLLQPPDIWRAYKRLSAGKVRGNPAGTPADIVMLVRYAIGETEALEPLPGLVAGRFNLWLGREEKAGRLARGDPRSSGGQYRDDNGRSDRRP